MYQDFPTNFDTSSRGSSTSPGHPETYSSITTQQVGASPTILVARLLRSDSDISFYQDTCTFSSPKFILSPICGPVTGICLGRGGAFFHFTLMWLCVVRVAVIMLIIYYFLPPPQRLSVARFSFPPPRPREGSVPPPSSAARSNSLIK